MENYLALAMMWETDSICAITDWRDELTLATRISGYMSAAPLAPGDDWARDVMSRWSSSGINAARGVGVGGGGGGELVGWRSFRYARIRRSKLSRWVIYRVIQDCHV